MSTSVIPILAPGGPVASRLAGQFEPRAEQAQMAEAVARALEGRGRLLVEAGTGVGKSFAYLVPAIARAITRGEKVVVATATIALQEQLITKDIPLLAGTLAKWGVEAGKAPSPALGDPRAPSPAEAGEGSVGKAPGAFDLIPVLAKGRGNYVSIRRLELASRRQAMLPDRESLASLHVIEDWAGQTRDGSLSTLPAVSRPQVWEHVRSDGDNCMGRQCAYYKNCFYQSARRELEKANLIVCNHALFFSDLALRVRAGASAGGPVKAILPNYDHVIFDEAHGLEDTASEHFGMSLAMPRVLRLLRTLYSGRRRKGYLLERSLKLSAGDGDPGLIDRAITLVGHAEGACEELFEDLRRFALEHRSAGGRIRAENVVDNPLTPALRELAIALRRIREGIEDEAERLELGGFAKRASDLADAAEAMIGQTLGDYVYWIEGVEGDERSKFNVQSPNGSEQGEDDGEQEDVGGWGGGGDRRRNRVTLACAPVEVGPILKKHLFSPEAVVVRGEIDEGSGDDTETRGPGDAEADAPPPGLAEPRPPFRAGAGEAAQAAAKRVGIVLTSATLATRAVKDGELAERAETAFAHVMQSLGIPEARTLQLGSPFDYRTQAKVIVDLSVPDPKNAAGGRGGSGGGAGPSYYDVLAERVLHHVTATGGGAFVLFTSFATLNAVASRIGPRLERGGLTMLVQGRDGPRGLMLKRYLEVEEEAEGARASGWGRTSGAVLLGAASFWQGVDVRGERLRNVVITRLPFEPPDRPLTQARMERIELAGGNPFMQDSLPRAIIKFKQGFGRLIRSRTDTGRVVVLDPRVTTARYGRMFLEALPRGVPVEVLRPEPRGDGPAFDPGW